MNGRSLGRGSDAVASRRPARTSTAVDLVIRTASGAVVWSRTGLVAQIRQWLVWLCGAAVVEPECVLPQVGFESVVQVVRVGAKPFCGFAV